MSRLNKFSLLVASLFIAAGAAAQTPVQVVSVVSKAVDRQVTLPGEFRPYLAVPIFAKVTGFVRKIDVDRGSVVKQGQLLATLEAPEMRSQVVEAQSKAQAIELQRAEAVAKLASAQSTYDRLKAASATPGVVAENDVVVAEKSVEAAQALVRSYEDSIKAAQAQVQAVRDLEQYLTIKAPFDGIITERNVHPGALVGPAAGSTPLLRLHQISRLRLVVAVPEALVGGIVKGARVPFTVPAYPGEPFVGVVSLIAHDLDDKTRTMPVELDVRNADLRLGAGMYSEVRWPVKRPQASLLVPPTSIVTTTERTFVIRVKDGTVEWVDVGRGARIGELIEVFGLLKEGDVIVRRATDELRAGTKVTRRPSRQASAFGLVSIFSGSAGAVRSLLTKRIGRDELPAQTMEIPMKTLAGAAALTTTLLAGVARADTVNFDNLKVGAPPPGWTATKTGTGDAKWTIETDDTAPSKPNVLKQSGRATYPICIKDDTSLKDGFVEVKFKPISGREDQAGGVIWRAKDANNYYIARANALEDNVTIYHTINGRRTEKKRTNMKVASNQWHSLRVDFQGSHFTVTFDGQRALEWDDDTFKDAGKVGVWTKADSVTLFDDFAYGAR